MGRVRLMVNKVQRKSFGDLLIDRCGYEIKRVSLKVFTLFTLFTLFGSFAKAEENKKSEDNWTWEQAFIRSNLYVTEVFDGVAEKIDLFLSRKDKSNRRNDTSVKIENSSNSSEGQWVTNYTHLNVNLRLPNLEEYWQLKFTTYDNLEESRGVRRGYLPQVPREKNYGASIGLFKKLGKIRTAFQPRIELQDPLKVSHSLRFDSVANLETYEIHPRLEFFANPDKGTGIFGGVNLNFILSKYYNLIVINEGEYQEKLNLFSSNSGLILQQNISEKSALSYNIFFNSNSRPAYHLESYSFSISWSEVIYKKILDYQIIPHLDFSREASFKGSAGLTFNISINF